MSEEKNDLTAEYIFEMIVNVYLCELITNLLVMSCGCFLIEDELFLD